MISAANYLIKEVQGFQSRAEQYKIIGRTSRKVVLDRFIVKHQLTGERFLMKVMPIATEQDLKD